MKIATFNRLAPLVGIALLFALMIHGTAAEPKKTATAPKTGATPAAATTAPLKAKSNPKVVVLLKRPPIATLVPFKLEDFKDKNGKVPTANETTTLANGTTTTWGKYVAALNKAEANFNKFGITLHGNSETLKVQQLNYNAPKLEQQAKKKLVVAKLDARAQSLLTSPKVLQDEYNKAAAAYKVSAKAVKVPPGAINQVLQPAIVTKSFDDSFGDASTFAVDVNGSLTFTGAQSSAAVAAQAQANASIFGNTETLAQATANITAPRSGNMTAQVKVTILGIDDTVLDQSQAVTFSKTDTFTRSLPDSFKVTYNTTIFFIPVSATVGAKGSITVPYFVSVVPGQAMGWMIPEVDSSVYGQAGIGAEEDDTGIVAGVEVDLILLNNKLTLFGSASQGTDTKGTFLSYSIISRNDMTALKGSISLFLEVEINLIVKKVSKKFTEDLFSFGGLGGTTNPLSGGDKVYLGPPVLKEAPLPATTPQKSAAK